MPDQRLKGQEISIRVTQQGTIVDSFTSFSSFNEEVDLEIKGDGFLGEGVNRFDEILNGYGGDFEMQLTTSAWMKFQQNVIARATRTQPDLVFNVIRTDFFPNGESLIVTYLDVKWGGMPTSVGSRGDYAKVKGQFKCSDRSEQFNQV